MCCSMRRQSCDHQGFLSSRKKGVCVAPLTTGVLKGEAITRVGRMLYRTELLCGGGSL